MLCYNVIWCVIYFNQNLKEGAAVAVEQFQEAESEAKALCTMRQRMILTEEEMVRDIEMVPPNLLHSEELLLLGRFLLSLIL